MLKFYTEMTKFVRIAVRVMRLGKTAYTIQCENKDAYFIITFINSKKSDRFLK